MWTHVIQPRFSETDALGHINNAVLPTWFEEARTPVFRLFMPDLDMKAWCLILARIEIDFKAELHHGHAVEIRSRVAEIGRSSLALAQDAWQAGQLGAASRAVIVHFDYAARQARPIPEAVRAELERQRAAAAGA